MLANENVAITSSKSIFILYLIISGNFLVNLFGCRTQRLLNTSMWMKHLLGFMTMYFFVVLVDNKSKNPTKQLLFTLFFYFIFLLTTKMDYKWWIGFIIGLSIIYILQVFKDNDNTKEEERKQIETYQTYLTYIVSIIIIVGVLIYHGKKRIEYGEKFDMLTFFIGKPQCAFNKELKISDYESLKKVIDI